MSRQVATITDETLRAQLIAQMKVLKDDMQKEEDELKEVMKRWHELMLQVPNIPDMSVPDGESDRTGCLERQKRPNCNG